MQESRGLKRSGRDYQGYIRVHRALARPQEGSDEVYSCISGPTKLTSISTFLMLQSPQNEVSSQLVYKARVILTNATSSVLLLARTS